MITIMFSNYYNKFPDSFNNTKLINVEIVNLEELNPEFLEQDTAIKGGGHYKLPKYGKYMILWLETTYIDGNIHFWQTIRRWTQSKEIYYKNNINKLVNIEVNIHYDRSRCENYVNRTQ